MRHECQRSLHSLAAASQSVEKDPVEGDVAAPCSTLEIMAYQLHADAIQELEIALL